MHVLRHWTLNRICATTAVEYWSESIRSTAPNPVAPFLARGGNMTPRHVGCSGYRLHLAYWLESSKIGQGNLPCKLRGIASLGPTSAFRLCSLCAIDILQSNPCLPPRRPGRGCSNEEEACLYRGWVRDWSPKSDD